MLRGEDERRSAMVKKKEEVIAMFIEDIPLAPPQSEKPRIVRRKKGHLLSPYERKLGHVLKMCPQCGGALKVRHGRYGKRFLGCSGYPTCRYTQPL